MSATSVTLSVHIACPAAKAFQFVADPSTMPQWAIHNVKGIRHLSNDEWEIQTPRGTGKLIPHFNAPHGILDHEFVDPREGAWNASARVVSAGPSDSVYMITLVKPLAMPLEAFMQGVPLVQQELDTMKRILEPAT
jgi:hypothetical protein